MGSRASSKQAEYGMLLALQTLTRNNYDKYSIYLQGNHRMTGVWREENATARVARTDVPGAEPRGQDVLQNLLITSISM